MSARVRFAPSPTGALHVGNARTALFNWLFARKEQGTFVLRIEDSDTLRSDQASVDAIVNSLEWLGLNWDEGFLRPDPQMLGPYRQSERLEYYRELGQQLLASGRAYLCYENDAELEASREAWIKDSKKTRHPQRDLTAQERARFEAEGRKPSVRFATDDLHGEVVYDDLVRGVVSVDMEEIRDFNLIKSDGMPMYNFAAVADDHAMQISHVLRGEDGISNTPRQLLIYKALGWEAPRFGHVSFILGPDGQKLSKRHGGSSVEDLKRQGYLPEAVVNYLGLLGLGGHGEGEEIFSADDLVRMFSSSNLIKRSAIFDYGKLNFLNAHYLRALSPERLRALVIPFLEKAGVTWPSVEWLDAALDLFKGNAVTLNDFSGYFEAAFRSSAVACAEAVEKARGIAETAAALGALLEALRADFPADAAACQVLLKSVQAKSGVKGKSFFMPVRLALMDSEHGPELNRLLPLIGADRSVMRLEIFLKALA
ncbi:MAG: glutamate--tRNA ligase [candidate division FCPU426 bacterium]